MSVGNISGEIWSSIRLSLELKLCPSLKYDDLIEISRLPSSIERAKISSDIYSGNTRRGIATFLMKRTWQRSRKQTSYL